MTISAGSGAPPLKSVSLGLTGGLRFSGARGHINVTGPGGRAVAFSSRVVRGRLVLTLGAAAGRIRVTVAYNVLTSSASLASNVRTHHRSALRVTVATTDATSRTVTTTVKIKPRN
jgi:hypothetical protein